MFKVAAAAQRHRAACRDYRREANPLPQVGGGEPLSDWMLEEMDRSGPTSEHAEEVERLLRVLPDDLRQILLWVLEGYTNKEIAEKIERTERMVELKRQQIRVRLARSIDVGS